MKNSIHVALVEGVVRRESHSIYTHRPNPALNLAPFGRWTLRDEAAQRRLASRVRRAWRVTSQVKVLWPGFRGAEGKEKGKGVVARRGLKEAQSETAGR